MSLEPTIVGIIIGSLIAFVFIVAGVVLYVGKSRQKRRDATSLPGGEQTSFNEPSQPVNASQSAVYPTDDLERYLD